MDSSDELFYYKQMFVKLQAGKVVF